MIIPLKQYLKTLESLLKSEIKDVLIITDLGRPPELALALALAPALKLKLAL